MGNMGLNDKGLHDFEKKLLLANYWGAAAPPVATALYIIHLMSAPEGNS
jgi:hypothetical protein